jgi:MATE family multidrug resistance protein
MGLPLGGQMLLEVAAFAILTAMFSAMSEVDVAAHQIALQVIHFSFLPALAIGEAASVMVGQAVGADRDELVRPLARQTLWLVVLYTGLCALACAAAAWPIAGAFSDDPALRRTTVHLLYIAAAFQIFDGANIVGRSVLRGTGDVRWPAVVNVAMAWLVTPPLALLLGYGLGWGVSGGWLGFCAEIIGGALLLWWRLERGHWLLAAKRSRLELDEERCPSSRQSLVAAQS